MKHQLHIIPSQQIDRSKWNEFINKNNNGFIYANSLYLDTMTDHWHGLIIDDYKVVLPLPWKKKWGITYLYTPPFMQQLGLIGDQIIDLNAVINDVQSFANYGDHLFNFANNFTTLPTTPKNNFILDLSSGYQTIYKNYKTNLCRNLNRQSAESLFYSVSEDIQSAIELHRQLQSENILHVTTDDYDRFKKLCILLQTKQQCIIREVKNKKGEILSAALLLKDQKRLYNIINATIEQGKNQNANHFLMDQIIREFAGQKLLFDFEGSNIPGVKKFYEMFGALNQPYFHWHYNKLPWPLQLFKR